jgi:hypothetical protein
VLHYIAVGPGAEISLVLEGGFELEVVVDLSVDRQRHRPVCERERECVCVLCVCVCVCVVVGRQSHPIVGVVGVQRLVAGFRV